LWTAVAAGPAGWGLATTPAAEPPAPMGKPRLLSKEVFLRHENRRPHVSGFVVYVSAAQPILMHCSGREDYSDGYDDFALRLSADNGRTWSKPEVRWKSSAVPAGRIRYAEPAAYFDAQRGKLVVLIDKVLYPKDQLDVGAEYALELNVYDAATGTWTERRELSFPGQRSPAMSFSFPIRTAEGVLIFPGMRQMRDASGKAAHYKGCWAPVDEVVAVIGRWTPEGSLTFRLGNPLQIDPQISSRGLDENALFPLSDGRVAAICRGDNSMFPERPGYKWLSLSRDGGLNWSPPEPLPATGGAPIESGANGSALFRSQRNGRLYWLGNLALDGRRPNGNQPRWPLCLVEVQENPFALKRETVFRVDTRAGGDSDQVQLSNFRFYQDRDTGDLVIFLTRYGERSAQEWMLADYYRYRVAMPDGPRP
jgi:hypothetical protein